MHSEQAAARIRLQKAQMRNEAGLVKHFIQQMPCHMQVRRCSTCPEGGDATYVHRKEVYRNAFRRVKCTHTVHAKRRKTHTKSPS